MGGFNFRDDLTSERAVNQFLSKFLYTRLKERGDILDFLIENDLKNQHAGVDVVLVVSNKYKIVIDEKAAMHYAKSSLKEAALPTFAFEISYEYKGKLKEGWLTNTKYDRTEDYLLCWLWVKSPVNSQQLKCDDIIQIEAMFLKKKDIQNFIINEVTNSDNLINFRDIALQKRISLEEKLNQITQGKVEEPVGQFNYPKWYLTGKDVLNESPLNIVLNKKQLLRLAKSHWLITKTELKRLDKE